MNKLCTYITSMRINSK